MLSRSIWTLLSALQSFIEIFAERSMPRYFFHIDGKRRNTDPVGAELADLEAAKREALKITGELMIDNALGDIWSGGEWIMTVADQTARELFSIRLSTSQCNGADPG